MANLLAYITLLKTESPLLYTKQLTELMSWVEETNIHKSVPFDSLYYLKENVIRKEAVSESILMMIGKFLVLLSANNCAAGFSYVK